jgi:hypothetical protein
MGLIHIVVLFIRAMLRKQAELATENLALRQQLAALQHGYKRPRLRKRDRIFWAILSRAWANWRSALLIVQPDTVVRWHRNGFRILWRWKSRTGKVGRRSQQSPNADNILAHPSNSAVGSCAANS